MHSYELQFLYLHDQGPVGQRVRLASSSMCFVMFCYFVSLTIIFFMPPPTRGGGGIVLSSHTSVSPSVVRLSVCQHLVRVT